MSLEQWLSGQSARRKRYWWMSKYSWYYFIACLLYLKLSFLRTACIPEPLSTLSTAHVPPDPKLSGYTSILMYLTAAAPWMPTPTDHCVQRAGFVQQLLAFAAFDVAFLEPSSGLWSRRWGLRTRALVRHIEEEAATVIRSKSLSCVLVSKILK